MWRQVFSGHQCKQQAVSAIQAVGDITEVFDEIYLRETEGGEGDDMKEKEEEVGLSVHALSAEDAQDTIKIQGGAKGKSLAVLIDTESTHSFIDTGVAKETKADISTTTPLIVTVANGQKMLSKLRCSNYSCEMQGEKYTTDLRVIWLEGSSMILGIDWLRAHGPVTFDYNNNIITITRGEADPPKRNDREGTVKRDNSQTVAAGVYCGNSRRSSSNPEGCPRSGRKTIEYRCFMDLNPSTSDPISTPTSRRMRWRSLEEHADYLTKVLSTLKANQLYAKRSKCYFGQRRVDYLGFVITEEGVTTDHSKIEAMLQWPIPKVRVLPPVHCLRLFFPGLPRFSPQAVSTATAEGPGGVAAKPAMRKPVFTKVDQLKPGTSGHTLTVKVVSSETVLHKGRAVPSSANLRRTRIAERLVGDETGTIVFTARNEQGKTLIYVWRYLLCVLWVQRAFDS
uniref:Single-stranded DNA binding protein Ssb-like OB fold domain-containing protein n=1 Tax=Ananas comosus var. bracteatus TaxID=296719 RepID=A0A6V7PKU8_ANACO|nr:unnamed protein product [Ananas comosus var. bracteatus]